MENTDESWVNNECGDFMWDDALKSSELKVQVIATDDKIKSTTEKQPAPSLEKIIVL